MKFSRKIFTPTYLIILLFLTIYSYSLVDPNLTLINHPLWTTFRNSMVQLGYYERGLSFSLYLMLVILLFACHYYYVFKSSADPFKLALKISGILLLSYPFLSHDFFNYLFDAKIVTVYAQNPYLKTALDFPSDPWIRFMHWTHRPYPYGPSWLGLTIIPSFLSLGKFILDFFLFKAMFAIFYLASVYYLKKLNRTWAIFFATSPLVIIEGLVNNHNDLIATSFALVGICFLLFKDNQIPKFYRFLLKHPQLRWFFNFVHFLLSAGIKYMTLPTLILPFSAIAISQTRNRRKLPLLLKSDKLWSILSFIGVISAIVYVINTGEIQPWYFLNLLIFIPYFFQYLQNWQIFFAGLLLSYYPYIFLGGWDSPEKVSLKHQIIIYSFVANVIYLAFKKVKMYK